MENNPFNNLDILDWFCSDIDIEISSFPIEVITYGSGPFEEAEFDSFLNKFDIQIEGIGSDLDTLIIGRLEWDEESLDEQIELRRERHLKVYSQEMAIAYIRTGNDPYDLSEILEIFGEGHPALEYLTESGFDWPRTQFVPIASGGEIDDFDWQKLGFLKYMGYQVGIYGKSQQKRFSILENVLSSELPKSMPAEYKDEWGNPNSAKRLNKMANTIASLARNAKRKHDPPKKAIEDWEFDLDWLKSNYYRGSFLFKWPSTYVKS